MVCLHEKYVTSNCILFLAHPNVKVFVTQGGLQSIEEAISKNVPMVGIPFTMDQPLNVKRLVELGMAESIKPSAITRTLLRDVILKVAGNRE